MHDVLLKSGNSNFTIALFCMYICIKGAELMGQIQEALMQNTGGNNGN